jgi:hypothetical protein
VRAVSKVKFSGLVLFGAAVLCLQTQAWAYADPGSGTLLWQMLVAVSVGFMFNIRRILAWLRSVAGKQKTPERPE